MLFNPGMRHDIEEKAAKQMLREEEGTGRKGRLGIDLDSGVVVIGTSAEGTPTQEAVDEEDRAGDADEPSADRDDTDPAATPVAQGTLKPTGKRHRRH